MTVPAWKLAEDQRTLAKFDTDATVDANGVVRWNSNNRVPPDDILRLWNDAGKNFNIYSSHAASNAEMQAFFEEYRKAQKTRSKEQIAEQRAEARAAMGPGVKMVNVFTGERYTT